MERPFSEPWGRPQNDGPALRAIALSRFAHQLIEEGEIAWVREHLYDGTLPTNTVIKADLEFVSHHWHVDNFGLWEEIKGHHFFTRLSQWKALVDGAHLAKTLGDGGAAKWYLQQADLLSFELQKHWDGNRGHFVPTLMQTAGVGYKTSGLDASVVIGSLLLEADDKYFSITDPRIQGTVYHLIERFRSLYRINEDHAVGPAIGRYPEDLYDGYQTDSQGNPWVLTTNAFANYYYQLRMFYDKQGKIVVTKTNHGFLSRLSSHALIEIGETILRSDPRFKQLMEGLFHTGEGFLKRVHRHANPDGSLSEQINRHTGYLQGAPSPNLELFHFYRSCLAARKNYEMNRPAFFEKKWGPWRSINIILVL